MAVLKRRTLIVALLTAADTFRHKADAHRAAGMPGLVRYEGTLSDDCLAYADAIAASDPDAITLAD